MTVDTLHLAIINAPTVMTARVNQGAFTYPIDEITMDGVSTVSDPGGDWQFVREEMVVIFGTTALGDDLGRQRIRKVPTSTALYIGRSSQGARDGEVNLEDDAYITVFSEYRVWPKLPYINPATDPPTIYKDSELTKPTDWPPVANSGAYTAATVNASGVYRVTLPEDTNQSFAVADGATLSTYTWELPSGASLVSTESPGGASVYDTNKVDAQRITVDSPAGFRWYALTVTDDNGETHRSYTGVYAYDPDTALSAEKHIDKFEVLSHTHTPQGQKLSVRITGDLDKETYPDGSLVFMWEGEPADSEDRTHMKFFGYHQGDPQAIRSERTGIVKDITFECVDVAGRLAILPGFPFVVGGDSSNFSDWSYMADPNWFKFMHYCLWWHSSALSVADWIPDKATLDDYPFVVRSTSAGNLYQQMQSQALAVVPDFQFTCNRQGQLLTRVDPMVQASGDRTIVVQASLDEDDWTALEYTNQFWPRYHWLREEAMRAHATSLESYFAIAPGESPGMGEGEQPHGEQLALSQADLNETCGQRYGRLNSGLSPFIITLGDGDDRDIDPALMQWVRLTISSSYAAQRGLAFTNARGLPLRVEWRYRFAPEGYSKVVYVTWEKETVGIDAVTYTYPEPS